MALADPNAMVPADPIVKGPASPIMVPAINQSPGVIGLGVTNVMDAGAEYVYIRQKGQGIPLLHQGHPIEGYPVEFDLEKSAYELIRCRRHSL